MIDWVRLKIVAENLTRLKDSLESSELDIPTEYIDTVRESANDIELFIHENEGE